MIIAGSGRCAPVPAQSAERSAERRRRARQSRADGAGGARDLRKSGVRCRAVASRGSAGVVVEVWCCVCPLAAGVLCEWRLLEWGRRRSQGAAEGGAVPSSSGDDAILAES